MVGGVKAPEVEAGQKGAGIRLWGPFRSLWLPLIVLGVALILLVPNETFLFVFLTNIFIFVILALGLQIILGAAGMLDLCHAAFFGVGAYTYALLATSLHWPFLLALPVAILVTLLAGAIIAPIVRLREVYFALATFSLGLVATTLFKELPLTGGINGFPGIPRAEVFGFSFDDPIRLYLLTLFFVCIQYVIYRRLLDSPFGMSLNAVRQNELASRAIGINVALLQVKTILFGVASGGLAGSLLAISQNFVSPDVFSVDKSIFILVIVVVGGLNSLPGAVLGAILLMFVAEYTRELQELIMLVYGAVLAACMIFLPRGLWGLIEHLARRAPRSYFS